MYDGGAARFFIFRYLYRMKHYMIKALSALSLATVVFACGEPVAQRFSPIIPQPWELSFEDGSFTICRQTVVYTNLTDKNAVSEWLSGLPLDTAAITTVAADCNSLEIILNEGLEKFGSPEACEMTVSGDGVRIEAAGLPGLFYGVQNLHQLYAHYGASLPAIRIVDRPRFAQRGLMLDLSSHYLSPRFICKQMDMMARYKLNRLQLYLGGEGGWRIPISGYESLTENTAWRTVSDYREWQRSSGKFCNADSPAACGGFYTRAEISDMVDYARARQITIVPMIDLPCVHGDVALRAAVGCTPKEEGLFVERAVAELVRLFGSEYVYIGNGEADDARGTACPSCRKRVDKERTFDRNEPHGDALRMADNLLTGTTAHKLMAWEESLRAGVSTDVAVIAWHSAQEGWEAAAKGHKVIMAPAEFVSMDTYQSDPTAAPEAMAGFLPLEKVYAFNPVRADMPEGPASNIMGIQANMWTRFANDESRIEYMLWPRLIALAEAGWSTPERKSYYDFRRRVAGAVEYLGANSYNCFDLENEMAVRPQSTEPVKSLATGKKAYYHLMFDDRYPGSGTTTLTDGQRGDWWYGGDNRWQGFMGKGVNVTIDLGGQTPVRSVFATFVKDLAGNVYLPAEVRVSVSSDGERFDPFEVITGDMPEDTPGYHLVDFGWKGEITTRYVRYEASANKRPGSWLFLDEIVIR
jgi:hexosaminidase